MRRRWIYDHVTGSCIEVDPERKARPQTGPFLMPDLSTTYNGGFQSPINGEFITSRSQLRAHEQKYGVRQAGDFRKGEIIGGEQRRVERIREKSRGEILKWR